MHLKCSVNGCKEKTDEVDLYNFPRSGQILQTWIDFCDRGRYWRPSKNAQICSAHFSRADVQNYPSANGRARQLKPNACPTIKLAPKPKMLTCAVINCGNSGEITGSQIKYFEFPSEPKSKAIWLQFCGRDSEWHPGRLYRICSDHFRRDEIESSTMRNKKFTKLKSGVVPTLKGPTPAKVTELDEPPPKKMHLEERTMSKTDDSFQKSPEDVNQIQFLKSRTPSSSKTNSRNEDKIKKRSNKNRTGRTFICSVTGCQNSLPNSETSTTFHKFPKDATLLNKWIAFCRKDASWIPDENSRICSKHFHLKEFDFDPIRKYLILKIDALPSLNYNSKPLNISEPNSMKSGIIEISLTNMPGVRRNPAKPDQEKKVTNNIQRISKSNKNSSMPRSKSSHEIEHSLKTPKSPKTSRSRQSTPLPQEEYESPSKELDGNAKTPKMKRKSSMSKRMLAGERTKSSIKDSEKNETVTKRSIRKSSEPPPKISRSVSEEHLNKYNEPITSDQKHQLYRSSSHVSLEKIGKNEASETSQFESGEIRGRNWHASRSRFSSHQKSKETTKFVEPVCKILEVNSYEAKYRHKRESKNLLESRALDENGSSRKEISNFHVSSYRNPRSRSLDSFKARKVSSPKLTNTETKDADADEENARELLNVSCTSGDSVDELFNALSETLSADETYNSESMNNSLSRHESDISNETSFEEPLNKCQGKSSASGRKTPARNEHSCNSGEFTNTLYQSQFDNFAKNIQNSTDGTHATSPVDIKVPVEDLLSSEKPPKISRVIEVSLHNKKIKKKIKVTLNNTKERSSISVKKSSLVSSSSESMDHHTGKIHIKNTTSNEKIISHQPDSNANQIDRKLERRFENQKHFTKKSFDTHQQIGDVRKRLDPSRGSSNKLDEKLISSQKAESLIAETQPSLRNESSISMRNKNDKKIQTAPNRPTDSSDGSVKNKETIHASSKEKSSLNIETKYVQSPDSTQNMLQKWANVKGRISNSKFTKGSEMDPKSKHANRKKPGPRRFKRLDSKDDDVLEATQNTNESKIADQKAASISQPTILHHADNSKNPESTQERLGEVRFPFDNQTAGKVRVTLGSNQETWNVTKEKEISPKNIEPEKNTEGQTAPADDLTSTETKVEIESEDENATKRFKMSPGNIHIDPDIIDLSQEIKEEETSDMEEFSLANLNPSVEKSKFDMQRSYPKSIDETVAQIKTSPCKKVEDCFNPSLSSAKPMPQENDFVHSTTSETSLRSKSPLKMLVICQELQICEVAGCRNNSSKSLNGVTFHPFPLNIAQRNKWVEFCRDDGDWKPQDFSRICSNHFPSEDYVNVKLNNKTKKVLKIDAIPSVRGIANEITNTSSKSKDSTEESVSPRNDPVEIAEKVPDESKNYSGMEHSSPIKANRLRLDEQLSVNSCEVSSPVELGFYSPIEKENNSSKDQYFDIIGDEPQTKAKDAGNESSSESIASNDFSNDELDGFNLPSSQSDKSDGSSDEKYKLQNKVKKQKKLISSLYKSEHELKRKIRKQTDQLRTMQKRNTQMEQAKKDLQRKVLNLERTLKRKSLEDSAMNKHALRTKIMLSPIGKSLTENQIDLLLQIKKNVNWTTAELSTAFSLRYLSKDNYIYDYLKEIYPLPSIPAVQKYAQRICLYGGVLKDVIDIMNTVGKTMSDKDRATVLVYDSIPVQSKIQYDVDEDEIVGPYNRMHVIMARGLFSEWKQPVYIDFDRTLTAEELKNLVSELYDVQFNVVAFVCDCSQPKLNLLLELGVSGKNTFFEHPSTQKKICCFFDSPRLLEMMRKALVTKGFTFLDGTEMTREPLNKLLESGPYIFPDGTLFSPENMLNPADEEPGNYDHAMELFSLTIATLLRKSADRESVVLAKFVETMYRWFQIMSSLYVDGNDRLVLHYKDREDQSSLLNKTYDMVKSLRCIQTNRINIFQEAILISIRSLECLSKEMNEMYDDRSILGNKLSQNSLDAFLNLIQNAQNANIPPMNAIEKMRAIIFGTCADLEVESILTLTEERYITTLAFQEANISPVIREKPFEESLFTNSIKLDANMVIKNIEEEGILDPLVEYLTKKHRNQFCSSDGKLPPKFSLTKNDPTAKSSAMSFSNYARQMKTHCFTLENLFKQINKDGTLMYKTKTLTNFIDRIKENVNLHSEIIKSFLLQRILVRLKYLNMDMENDGFLETDTDNY